jgi:hypothetical protein
MVAITFRTDDGAKWGSGAGTRLTSSQVDNNFWNLKTAVETLQADLPDAAVGISTFVVEGDQFYVVLTDETTEGPYALPVIEWNFRGTWIADTTYTANDVVTAGSAVYYVPFTHVSGTVFDPGANDGNGNDYYEVMIDIGGYAMPTGGTAGQYLVKNSSTDYDTVWSDPPGVADDLTVNIEYLGGELISDWDLASNPTTALPAWTINDSVYTTGALTFTNSGVNNGLISIPVEGLDVGSWYLVKITGTIARDANYVEMSAPGNWYQPGNSAFLFQASLTSDIIEIDLQFYNLNAARTINSVSCRKVSATNAVTISNGVNPVFSIGYDPVNIFIGEGIAQNAPPYGTSEAAPVGCVAIGIGAMGNAQNPSYNMAIGPYSLMQNNGGSNIAVGYAALISATSTNNVAVGNYTLPTLTSGSHNLFFGSYCGEDLLTGSYNIGIGRYVLNNSVSGNRNIAIGYGSLVAATGSDNIAVGYNAGDILTTGQQNTIIGSGADASANNRNNAIAIGYGASVTSDNTAQIGDSSVFLLRVGSKSIGPPKHAVVAGAAAGDVTVTGIAVGDRIDEVIYYPASYDVIDLTSEFTITGPSTINNVGGTATAGGKLIVRWSHLTA